MMDGQTGIADKLVNFWQKKVWVAPFLIVLFSFPILQSLIGRQFPCGFDNNFHLWRAVEIENLLRSGVLFSRWAPHMAQGYGYPLYLFQSPLSAYLAAVLRVVGFSWATAVNSVYALGLVGSGLTTWLLARDLWGERGAIIAAVGIMFAPFHLYVLLYRGSMSESVAWLFPPLILWGLRRWQLFGQRRGLIAAVISFAALFFTHDVTAYTFFPFFIVWVAGMGWLDGSMKAIWRGLGGIVLGMGAGAFFWLPAILERGSIQFARAGSAWPFLYFNNFLPLDQLLALPRNADPLLLNDWPPRGLGALLFAVALLGIWQGWRMGEKSRVITAFPRKGVGVVITFTLAAYLFITLPTSQFVWDNVELLSAFQFPWRFLAPATLAAALLAGALGNGQWSITNYQVLIFPLVIVGLTLFHFGWLYPNLCDLPQDTTINGMVQWERDTHTIGTTASGELLPLSAQLPKEENVPPPWQARLLPEALPNDAQIILAEYGSLDATIELESVTSFTAQYRAFDFPGWRVRINGEAVEITPSQPYGLITFDVPNGRSLIQVDFTETPLRIFADLLSLFTLIALSIIIFKSKPISLAPTPPLPLAPIWLTLPLLLIVGKVTLIDQQLTPLHQTNLDESGTLTGLDNPLSLTFGDSAQPMQLRLLGHDEVQTAVSTTSPLVVTLYWQALRPLTQDYRVGLTLLDADGNRWSDELRDYRWLRNPPPTQGWSPEQYVRTSFFVDPLSGTPPGEYSLNLSLFEKESLTPLTIYDAAGRALGPTIEITTLTLTPPAQSWQLAEMEMQYPLEAHFANLTLWGSNVGLREAAPGDSLLMTLFYEAERAGQNGSPPRRSGDRYLLLDANETAVTQYPLTLSQFGEGIWRQQQLLRLPASLADGEYRWAFETAAGERVVWGDLTINAPQRLFDLPENLTLIDVELGESVKLVGVVEEETTPILSRGQAVTPNTSLTIKLVWQSVQEIDESYRVFVHVVAADGTIVAQSDGIPANWTRPTTGWQVGEYIIDTHQLTIPTNVPSGEYKILVGMVLPDGNRLTTSDGSDTVLIAND